MSRLGELRGSPMSPDLVLPGMLAGPAAGESPTRGRRVTTPPRERAGGDDGSPPPSPPLWATEPIEEEPPLTPLQLHPGSDRPGLTPQHSNRGRELLAVPQQPDLLIPQETKTTFTRKASRYTYDGEGIEVSDNMMDESTAGSMAGSVPSGSEPAPAEPAPTGTMDTLWLGALVAGGSFDDDTCLTTSMRKDSLIDRETADRELKRSLSDDMSYMHKSVDLEEDAASWDMDDDQDHNEVRNAWSILQDEYALGYGGGGSLPFLILGTSADDVASRPHVLSPPLMESLQCFLPYAVAEDNFWMKFSMVRDGASLHTMLQNVRGAQHTIIAVETVGGEVFGSFTSMPWRKHLGYFGTGEAFLWRMREKRGTGCSSVIDQAQMESELDVYPWTGENDFVQYCTHDKIAVGGGTRNPDNMASSSTVLMAPVGSGSGAIDRVSSWEDGSSADFGFGLAIDSELLHGVSNSCLTFGSPPLCKDHSNGSEFEILNMEVWTLTPCISEEEAEKIEMGRLFLDAHAKN